MVRKMKEKFNKDWNNCNLFISSGVVLDHRKKMKMLNFAFNSICTENLAQVYINYVSESLYALYNEYVAEYKVINANKVP